MDEAGAELRAAFGEPRRLGVGPAPHGDLPRGDAGHGSGIGPLEWYFNEGPRAVPGDGRRRQQHATSGSRRAYPDPTDPDFVPVGIDQLFDDDEHAVATA